MPPLRSCARSAHDGVLKRGTGRVVSRSGLPDPARRPQRRRAARGVREGGPREAVRLWGRSELDPGSDPLKPACQRHRPSPRCRTHRRRAEVSSAHRDHPSSRKRRQYSPGARRFPMRVAAEVQSRARAPEETGREEPHTKSSKRADPDTIFRRRGLDVPRCPSPLDCRYLVSLFPDNVRP